MYNEVCDFLGLFSESLMATYYAYHLQTVFPNPRAFNPGRFLLNGKLNPDVPNPAIMAFGYDKRWALFSSYFFTPSTSIAFAAYVLDVTSPFELSGIP